MKKLIGLSLGLMTTITLAQTNLEQECRERIVDANVFMGQTITTNSFACAESLEELGVSDSEYEQLSTLEKIALRVKMTSVQANAQNTFIDLQVYARANNLTHTEQYRSLLTELKTCVNNLVPVVMDNALECVKLDDSTRMLCAKMGKRRDSILLERILIVKDGLGNSMIANNADAAGICKTFGLGDLVVGTKVIKKDKVVIPHPKGRQSPKIKKRKILYSIECEKSL